MNESIALTEAVYYILLSLCSPLHGYGIMQRVEEMSAGRVKLAAGTLYGALNTLKERGWITLEGGADGPLEVSVSDGVLDSPLDAAPRALSSRAVSGGEMLTWTIEAPDERAVYTLFLGGEAAAALRYDAANARWVAEKP